MRLSISHTTRYDFSEPQARLVQLLRLTPQDSIDQTVVNWHIGVDCDVRLRATRDGFGNCVTMLYADGPIEAIALSVEGEVLTAGDIGLVRGVAEPFPPLMFRRAAERTRCSLDLLAFGADEAVGSRDPLDKLHRFNLALHRRFAYREKRHDDRRTAADAFTRDTAAPRDFAHMMIALAHSAKLPARYVSGYRPDDSGAHHAPHAWAEAYVDKLGWVAFDPSRGISADASYVRVAVAFDAAGAAPVAGSRLGHGDERLDVDVQVAPLGGDG